jgi:hypothetical protein
MAEFDSQKAPDLDEALPDDALEPEELDAVAGGGHGLENAEAKRAPATQT